MNHSNVRDPQYAISRGRTYLAAKVTRPAVGASGRGPGWMCLAVLGLTLALIAPPALAADAAPAAKGMDANHQAKARELMDKGVAYLLSKREENGGWSAGRGSGTAAMTSMVVKAIVQHPKYGPNDPVVAKAYGIILASRQSDGGIYAPREGPASYTSAVALMALSAAKDPKYDKTVQGLVDYLKGLQIVPGSESDDVPEENVGGVGYGAGPGRPDLSNVGMWMDALHDAGVEANDPAMQRAVAFVSRLQNSTETNSMAWATEGTNDGGFIYRCPGGRGGNDIRSYGSMTYTGFKSMLYAAVKKDDPRVKAAFKWIRRYWRLDSNPNMPEAQSRAGLFYYYQVFAKAMRAWGEDVITDAKGVKHNWREELVDALAKQIRPDGSWVNDSSSRWWEGNPVLTTCYAVLALEEATRP